MLRSSSFLLFILAVLLSICAVPANADGIPVYLVAGSTTITGNDVCGGPCTETVAFSFDVSFQPNPAQGNYATPYASNLTQIWSGNLGTFSQISPGPTEVGALTAACFGNENFVTLHEGGAFVDVELCSNAGGQAAFTTASVPSILDAYLWSCTTVTCENQFVSPITFPPGQGPFGNPPSVAVYNYGTVEYSVALLPEPPTIILLVSGMLALGLLGATHRKFLPPKAYSIPRSASPPQRCQE